MIKNRIQTREKVQQNGLLYCILVDVLVLPSAPLSRHITVGEETLALLRCCIKTANLTSNWQSCSTALQLQKKLRYPRNVETFFILKLQENPCRLMYNCDDHARNGFRQELLLGRRLRKPIECQLFVLIFQGSHGQPKRK